MGKRDQQGQEEAPASPPVPEETPAAAEQEQAPVTWWPAPAWVWGLALFAMYGILPYWNLPRESAWFAVVRYLLVPLALLVGWCALPLGRYAGRTWQRPQWLTRWDLVALVSILGIMLAEHVRYLVLPFTWKGDEEFFINRCMWIIDRFWPIVRQRYQVILVVILVVMGGGLFVRSALRRNVFPLLTVVGAVVAGMIIFTPNDPKTDAYLVRYPPLATFVEFLFANGVFGTFFLEWAHRLVSFLPMVLLLMGVYVWLRREGLSIWPSLGSALVLAFIPMVQYQTTLLHIEPMILVWMSTILYFAWRYTKESPLGTLYQVALIAAIGGFIKETTLPFILATWLWSGLALVTRQELGWGKRAVHGVRLFVISFLPVIPYMLLRSLPRARVPEQRAYGAHVEHLWNADVYSNYLHSLTTYMTIAMAVAALIGTAWLLKRKTHGGAAILAVIATLGYLLFFAMDDIQYVGYVRFMMHFWPIFLVGLIGLMVNLQQTEALPGKLKPLHLQVATLALLLANNLAFHPPAPGYRGVWGRMDTLNHERHFPINQAFAFVQQELPQVPIVITGLDYPYYHIAFLQRKHTLSGRKMAFVDDLERLSTPMRSGKGRHIILVHHRLVDAEPFPEDIPSLVKHVDFELGPRGVTVYEYVPLNNKKEP